MLGSFQELGPLRSQAMAAGINPRGGRLVGLARAKKHVYMRRLAVADLFVDSVSYNAHTTGADALSQGLPLVST